MGQNSITTNLDHGNILYVSGDFTLNLEYTDKAGNKSRPHTTEPFRFICVTSANRYLQGEKSLSFHVDDCVNGKLHIMAENACGRSANPFIIDCEITVPYFSLNLNTTSSEVLIKAVNTASNGRTLGSDYALSIKSVEVYTSSREKVFAQNYMLGVTEMRIDTSLWEAGKYNVYISDGDNIQERIVTIN